MDSSEHLRSPSIGAVQVDNLRRENNNHISWPLHESETDKLHGSYNNFQNVFTMDGASKASSTGADDSMLLHCSVTDEKEVKEEPKEDSSIENDDGKLRAIGNGAVDCVVCGDKASGKHYGQNSCEGCKSFFKRSVRRNLSYTCRGNRNCPVDLQHRNQCQYCRLQKCVKLGMRKEAVQRGRMVSQGYTSFPQLPYPLPGTSWQDSASSQLGVTALIHLLMKADQCHVRGGTHPIASGLDPFHTETTRLLSTVIDWIRNIPYFLDLSPNDQFQLVSSSWHIVFILTLSQYSISSLLYSSTVSTQFHHDGLNGILEVVEKLKSISTDSVEHICLKALAIFNPECPGLQDAAGVETVQTKVQWALEEYTRTHYSTQMDRFGKLLLRLTSLAHTPSQRVESYFFSRLLSRSGMMSMDRLVRELLVSQPQNMQLPSQQSTGMPAHAYNYNFGIS